MLSSIHDIAVFRGNGKCHYISIQSKWSSIFYVFYNDSLYGTGSLYVHRQYILYLIYYFSSFTFFIFWMFSASHNNDDSRMFFTQLENLMADCGGTLGLFIGLSVCTAMEFCELLIDFIIVLVKKVCRRDEKTHSMQRVQPASNKTLMDTVKYWERCTFDQSID